jgi:hypothetical protein
VRWLLFAFALAAGGVQAQEVVETRELIGRMGRSTALIVLTSTQRTDGDWRVNGEYLLIPSLVRRYVEGERSPQLGVTTLREGATPILFGRPPTGTLQGTWRDAKFSGVRLAPGGQERERFEFSEEFPPMDQYTASVRCEAGDARYSSTLAYTVEAGRLRARSFEWRSKLAPSGHSCAVGARGPVAQASLSGGLRFSAGKCSVTLHDLGDYVRASAENCAEFCGSQAYLEPVLIDKRGACTLLHPTPR